MIGFKAIDEDIKIFKDIYNRRNIMFKNSELMDEIEKLKEENKILRDENIRLHGIKDEIEKEFKRKEEHAAALMEVELNRKVDQQVRKVKDEYAVKEKELVNKNFEKLSSSLAELHEKGNATTRYIETASLKMMDMFGKVMGGKNIQIEDKTEGEN